MTLHDGGESTRRGRGWLCTARRFRPDPVTASLLHDLVAAPVLEKLQGISTIAVVPNADLAEIPFGALYDAGRRQYLAERFTTPTENSFATNAATNALRSLA